MVFRKNSDTAVPGHKQDETPNPIFILHDEAVGSGKKTPVPTKKDEQTYDDKGRLKSYGEVNKTDDNLDDTDNIEEGFDYGFDGEEDE